MSWYSGNSTVVLVAGSEEIWRKEYGPSDKVPVSGIYKCIGCKKEVTSNTGDPFPPQSHHQHAPQLGPIRWQLNVQTNTHGA